MTPAIILVLASALLVIANPLPQLRTRLEYRFQQHDPVILDLHTGMTVDSVWMVIGPSAT